MNLSNIVAVELGWYRYLESVFGIFVGIFFMSVRYRYFWNTGWKQWCLQRLDPQGQGQGPDTQGPGQGPDLQGPDTQGQGLGQL